MVRSSIGIPGKAAAARGSGEVQAGAEAVQPTVRTSIGMPSKGFPLAPLLAAVPAESSLSTAATWGGEARALTQRALPASAPLAAAASAVGGVSNLHSDG